MLLGRGSTLFRMSDLTPDLRGPLKYRLTHMSDDGRYLVINGDEGVTVLDRGTGQELGHLARAEMEQADDPLTGSFVTDSWSRLFTFSGSWVLSQYSLPDLELYARYVLPTAIAGEPGSAAAVEESDDRLVALTGGVLSVWDTKTKTILGEPVRLGTSLQETAWYRHNADLATRPGHPNQVAIVAPNGSVELWDIEQRRRVHTIPTKIDVDGHHEVIFEITGDRLASLGANGMIEVWDAETGSALRGPIAAPGVTRLLGFDSAGHLVTENESHHVEFWDLNTGRQNGSLRLAISILIDPSATVEEGRHLMVSRPLGLPHQLPITAQDWFDHLCRTLDRGFTESERKLLPPGTDLDPPCSKNR